jgi:hypothetical protein
MRTEVLGVNQMPACPSHAKDRFCLHRGVMVADILLAVFFRCFFRCFFRYIFLRDRTCVDIITMYMNDVPDHQPKT